MLLGWQMRSVCKSGCEARGESVGVRLRAAAIAVCRIPSEYTIHALTYGFDMLGMSHYLRLGLPDLLRSLRKQVHRSLLSSILPGRRALCRWA